MNDFIIGDEVVCVDSAVYLNITKGNTYSVLDVWPTKICIKNDNGSEVWYPKKLFIKAEQMNKENFIPKVGEPCIFNEVGEMPEITPKFVGDDHVVFMRNGVECVNNIKYFSPLKTTAEIEQGRIVDKSINTLGHSRDYDAIVDILNQLYRANLLSDKRVKPLSYEEFKEIIDLKFVWNYLASTGFIIQGGEQ